MFPYLVNFAIFYFLLIFIDLTKSEDVFCGGLTVYKQQWLAKAASTISSQTTSDLKECLNICCNIPNCNAVTFMGFISNNSKETPSTNCMMFSCREKCVVVNRPTAAEGVISVIINRTITTTTNSPLLPMANEIDGILKSTPSSEAIPLTFPRPPVDFGPESSSSDMSTIFPETSTNSNINSSTFSSTHMFLSHYTPIWAVGVAIVIAVVCIGLNVVLISAFCCYKRHKNRMRSENFTQIKTPTLHAFNPAT